MSEPTGRDPEQRLPATRPPSEPAPVERFTAPPSAHQLALTPERAAQIVRQSGNARWIGFLAVLVTVLFTIVYYFYELGIPGVADSSRLVKEAEAQSVTSVERGYNLYEANCSRCHGVNGEGGIGPKLNDQMKLATHLTPTYLANVLTVGGRYVCGNPLSLMPVWADTGGGPLNYLQIKDLIAFLRATNDTTYKVRDPGTNEPVESGGKVETFLGWRDAKFEPPASATLVPACWSNPASPAPSGSAAPSGSGAPSGSAAPSGAPSGGTVLDEVASGVQFQTTSLTAPADQPFQIKFDNQDAGIPHNIQIADGAGTLVFEGVTINGVNSITYDVPALAAGSYKFTCKWHPNMVGDLTVK